jgi:hypothetical protein
LRRRRRWWYRGAYVQLENNKLRNGIRGPILIFIELELKVHTGEVVVLLPALHGSCIGLPSFSWHGDLIPTRLGGN